jgi:hypothetical protein
LTPLPFLSLLQPLWQQTVPPPSSRANVPRGKFDDVDADRRSFQERINARADEILGWTGSNAVANGGYEAQVKMNSIIRGTMLKISFTN